MIDWNNRCKSKKTFTKHYSCNCENPYYCNDYIDIDFYCELEINHKEHRHVYSESDFKIEWDDQK